MGNRVPWNKEEALIIVDAFYQVKKGLITKRNAVKTVSNELRLLAIKNGIEIDDIFRNENGISMQMATLEHIYSEGETGLRSGSKLFREVMQLYSDEPEIFQNKLMEAKLVNDKMTVNFDDFLLSHFAYGIKADSPIELMRFKRFYVEDYSEECPWSDDDIRKMISQRCFLHEGKSYLICESKCAEVLNQIEELHANGAIILYYQDLYETTEEWFYNHGIFSYEMLKSFLQKYSDTIICRKSYLAWSRDTENALLKDYIKNVWGESVLHDYSELKERMEYVPIDKIKYALANNECFVWNSAETYTFDEKFIISEEDKMDILEYVKRNIEQKGFVSFDEMPLDGVFDENYELSETAIFSLVFICLLSDEYVKNNRAIAKKEIKGSAVELIEQYCRSRRELLIDDLFNQWEMRTGTHRQAEPLDIAYSTMVRVDANRFVSVDQVDFNEPSIDRVLDTMVVGEAIGLKEITSFALFPDCNFSWNLYLLESFCRRYSNTFKYMAVTTNSRNAGAIVRRECDCDYHTLLAQILANKDIPLLEEDVMNYLYDSGYIARHSYKYLQELIGLATELKEGRL